MALCQSSEINVIQGGTIRTTPWRKAYHHPPLPTSYLYASLPSTMRLVAFLGQSSRVTNRSFCDTPLRRTFCPTYLENGRDECIVLLLARTQCMSVSAPSTCQYVSRFHSQDESAASFRAEVTAATAAGVPDLARSARRTARSKPLSRAAQHIRRPTHKLVRSRFARHSFPHAAGCRVARQHLCFDEHRASRQRLRSCCQSTGTIGRYCRPMARNLAHADSSRARSGSSLRVTPVRRGAYGCLVERSERSESHLRSRDRRSSDQGHRGRCHTDQPRPWGRMRGARGAID